jgi:hypothetical protein
MRQLSDDHISRCWLEPNGSPPAIGAEATPAQAEKAAAEISIEPMTLPGAGSNDDKEPAS